MHAHNQAGIFPKLFERIMRALLRREQMDDDIAEIDQDQPPSGVPSIALRRRPASRFDSSSTLCTSALIWRSLPALLMRK